VSCVVLHTAFFRGKQQKRRRYCGENKKSKELWEAQLKNHEKDISIYFDKKLKNSVAAIVPPDFR